MAFNNLQNHLNNYCNQINGVNNNNENNDNNNENDGENDENIKIMSVSWQQGKLACCYYKLSTMELFVTHEAPDRPPEFPLLLNLYRYVKPTFMIASGSNIFLKYIIKIMGFSTNEINLDNLKINRKRNKSQMLSIKNFIIYPYDSKTIQQNYQKIIKLNLPGMERLYGTINSNYNKNNDNDIDDDDNNNNSSNLQIKFTEEDRRIFISSILPLNQDEVLLCLGNLLNYIDNKWKPYIYHTNQQIATIDGNLRITNLKIFFLQSQLLISDSTLLSFQIFKCLQHPSGFIKGSNINTKEGYSIYNLLNNCQSRIASKSLQSLLLQPIRDISQLQLSFSTINWYINEYNHHNHNDNNKWIIFKRYLKNIRNISQIFRNITINPNNIKNWKMLKQTIYNSYLIMKFCQDCVKNNSNCNLIEQLANNTLSEEDKQSLQNILYTLNAVIDLEESLIQNKFIIKENFDIDLDEKKSKMISIQDELQTIVRKQVEMIPDLLLDNIFGYYIPEYGYVIKIDKNQNLDSNSNSTNYINNNQIIQKLINTTNLKLLIETNVSYYFTSLICENLNQKYGDIYSEICEHELRICDRLIKYLNNHLPAIQEIINLCIQLDYMMSFAITAIERYFIKPEILYNNDNNNDGQLIHIEQGRHILWEIKQNSFITNNTKISKLNNNLITILIAPNASGKSVYMKQIGIIAYLTHIGCYVPAKFTKISLLDGIHTQMYDTESLYEATSSFLSDLQQMSYIMNTSTGQSLVLIDEFGKGTTDIEGQSLLVACIEEFLKRGENNCPITIISTHYTDIINYFKTTKYVQIQTLECERNDNGEIIPKFKLKTLDINSNNNNNLNNNFKSPIMINRIKQYLTKILPSKENL